MEHVACGATASQSGGSERCGLQRPHPVTLRLITRNAALYDLISSMHVLMCALTAARTAARPCAVSLAEPAAPSEQQPGSLQGPEATTTGTVEPRLLKQLRLRSAAAYLPHPDKEYYGGEDAHFVSNVAGGAIGVADGAL